MAIVIYAETADLAAWTGDTAPSNAATLLRSASILVSAALLTALYDADDAGLPTDTDQLQAVNDATCAQAALWAANSIDPTAGTGARTVKRSKLASGEIEYDSAAQAQARATSVERLCSEAFAILQDAGFTFGQPWSL